MWLKFFFFPDRPGLLAFVASDGKVCFKASDLGKFLHYSNVYNFASKYATRELNQVIPRDDLPSWWKKSGLLVVDFLEMISIIRKTGRLGENKTKQLIALWYFGTVTEFLPQYLSLNPNCAFPLHVHPSGREKTRLQDWMRKCVEMRTTEWKNSENFRNENSKKRRLDTCVSSPSSNEVSSVKRKRISSSSFELMCLSPSMFEDQLSQSSLEVNCLTPPTIDRVQTSFVENDAPKSIKEENDPSREFDSIDEKISTPPSNSVEKNISTPIASSIEFDSSVFEIKYENFKILPNEICIFSRGEMHVYKKKN